MYCITAMLDGTYWCEGRVQDGTERWPKPTRKEATQSMIQFARVMNGMYITKKDITYLVEETPIPMPVSDKDSQMLADIKSHRLIVLNRDDLRIKYGITDEECRLIVKIREGDAIVRYK